MAKILDLGRYLTKRRNNPTPFETEEDVIAPERKRRGKVLSMSGAKFIPEHSWPASSSRASLNAWGALLLAIGVLCGLYLGRADSRPPASRAATGAQHPTGVPSPSLALAPRQRSKPSPMVPAVRSPGSLMPGQGAAAEPTARYAEPSPRYRTTRFEATHKKAFGGCTGQLELTAAGLHFRCPDRPDLNFPVDEIAAAHKDGVMLKSGEKYHFAIANRSKDQVEGIFASWLNRVQQSPQPRGASF